MFSRSDCYCSLVQYIVVVYPPGIIWLCVLDMLVLKTHIHIIFSLMKHKYFHNHGNKLLLVHE